MTILNSFVGFSEKVPDPALILRNKWNSKEANDNFDAYQKESRTYYKALETFKEKASEHFGAADDMIYEKTFEVLGVNHYKKWNRIHTDMQERVQSSYDNFREEIVRTMAYPDEINQIENLKQAYNRSYLDHISLVEKILNKVSSSKAKDSDQKGTLIPLLLSSTNSFCTSFSCVSSGNDLSQSQQPILENELKKQIEEKMNSIAEKMKVEYQNIFRMTREEAADHKAYVILPLEQKYVLLKARLNPTRIKARVREMN
jgi:hypothetical protein